MNHVACTQKAIPNVLLDFLHSLIDSNGAIIEIKLISNALGAGEVQDIICLTKDGSVFHRVFGFTPVNARLKVSHDEGTCELIAA